MRGTHQDKNANGLPQRIVIGFVSLLESFDYAEDTESSRWDFAVPIQRLEQLGMTETDFRWLVRKSYVVHAREITRLEDNGREFHPTGDLSFCEETCFVLTDVGVAEARLFTEHSNYASHAFRRTDSGANLPIWDAGTRELRLDGKIVKQFKWQATNQEIVLSAFHEDGWPPVIDDPLPPKDDTDPKRRLHDTIKALNRNHEHELIRFHGNGTGEGVRWKRTCNREGEKNHPIDLAVT